MPNRFFLPLLALVALALVALSLVWPQGLGQPSPAPFGKPLPPENAVPARTVGVPSTPRNF